MNFEKGDYFQRQGGCIFARSKKGVWRPVEIRKVEDGEVTIHYTGYDDKHDEPIPIESDRFFINADLSSWGTWEKHLCGLASSDQSSKKIRDQNLQLRNQAEVQETLISSLKKDHAQLAQSLEAEKRKNVNQREESSMQISALKEQIRILMDQNVELKNTSSTATPAPANNEDNNEVLERVMQKLSDAQEQLMKKEEELNAVKQNIAMINNENKDYRKAHDAMSKDKDKLMKENKKLLDQMEKLKAKGSQADESKQIVETLSKRASELEEQLSISRMDADTAKDALKEKTSHASELSGRIEALEFQAKEKDARLQHEAEKFERINSELAGVTKEFSESKAGYESRLDAIHAEREKLTIEVEGLSNQLQSLTSEHGETTSDLDTCKKKIVQLEAELSSLKEESAQKEVDNETDRKIAHKRLSNLVKQLRAQLAKEATKNQALQAQLLEAKDRLRDSNASLNPATLSKADEDRDSIVSTDIDPSISNEFADAMGERLQKQTEENFKLKEKIKFLEGSIQEITEDLYQRKVTLRNIMLRIDTGALTTELEQQNRKAKKLGKNRKIWEELVNRMEIVVTETSLQNDQLRKEKKQLAEEVQRLFAKAQQMAGNKQTEESKAVEADETP